MSWDVDRILAETFVRHVEQRDETESTNDLARERLTQGRCDLPMLAICHRQTRGRGRGRNPWWASDGSLTFTLVIDANQHRLASYNWPKLSLTTGLSVCATLEEFAPDCTIRLKWPNDVYLEGRKICGILIETMPARPQLLVIGIGINVNNSFCDAPREQKAIATSLLDEVGRQCDLTEVLVWQLRQLADCIERVRGGEQALAEAWRSRCLLEGRTLTVDAGPRQVTGVCHGIDDEGALLVQCEGGVERLVAGIVTRIL